MDMPASPTTAEGLMDEVLALRVAVAEAAGPLAARSARGSDDEAMANLAHYLALRHHDLRPLQRRLMWHGLSSLSPGWKAGSCRHWMRCSRPSPP